MKENEIKESCCRFGEQRLLAGIVTEPATSTPRIAVVLVNAGLVPKYGPFRLYAQLARRLSREGFLTLRFDLGGIGDSGEAYTSYSIKKRTETEIRAAMEYLKATYRLDGVILGGLCSGAEDSFRYAEVDPRVTGVVMMDPFAYRTWGWRWRNLIYRIARRSMRMAGLYVKYAVTDGGTALVDYKYMEHAEASRILGVLIRRKVRIHFMYSGGLSEVFNHPRQLKTMFREIDFQGLVTLDFFPRLGHTQVLEEDRRKYIDAIAHHLLSYQRHE